MFCQSCGNKMSDGAKFCSNCGAASGALLPAIPSQLKKEVSKDIVPVTSFQRKEKPVDSGRSYENNFSKANVVQSVKEFSEMLQQYASATPLPEDKKRRRLHKFLRILVWIYGVGAGVILLLAGIADLVFFVFGLIYLVPSILFFIFVNPPLTKNEVQKSELITLFPIPNDKDSILEFMVMAKSLMEDVKFYSVFSYGGKKDIYWNKIWKKKFDQASAKAKMFFKDDSDFMEKIALIEAEFK